MSEQRASVDSAALQEENEWLHRRVDKLEETIHLLLDIILKQDPQPRNFALAIEIRQELFRHRAEV